jgi:emfourin
MQNSEDQEQPSQPPAPEAAPAKPSQPVDPAAETILGQIGQGPYDKGLSTLTPPTAASHRKATRESPASGTTGGWPAAPPAEEPLTLPRGGLVAMRKSGGMRFSSREIVVYRSGKMTRRQSAPAAGPAVTTRHLTLAQLAELHHALQQSDLARLPTRLGRPSGDTFAYEIVARVGRTVKAVEVFEGSIPASLAPLIRLLRGLMPEDEEGTDRPSRNNPRRNE